jgi:two-component system, NarL family, response regulator DevR
MWRIASLRSICSSSALGSLPPGPVGPIQGRGIVMSAVRVLIVDDQDVTRSGLTAMAKNSPRLSFIGEAYDAASAVRAATKLAPDVILVNLRALKGNALQELMHELDSATSVIVLRSRDSQVGLAEACQAGVAGIADLDALGGDLGNIVSLVNRGCAVCIMAREALTTTMFIGSSSDAATHPDWLSALTAREGEVLRLVAEGLTNKQIAARLHVAESTVKKHATGVMRKMGVLSRVEAALQFSHYDMAVRSFSRDSRWQDYMDRH